MQSDGIYFNDLEMRDRDPILFEQMIGQYQSQEEIQAIFHDQDRTQQLSSIFLEIYDNAEVGKVFFVFYFSFQMNEKFKNFQIF